MILESLEEFAKEYNNLISALTMLGTWGAVMVALWLSYKNNKPKLYIFCDKSVLISDDKMPREEGITISIKNRGNVPVYISYYSFYWEGKILFKTKNLQLPAQPIFNNEPIKLEAGQSENILITKNIQQHRMNLDKLCSDSNLPKFMKRFIRLVIYGQDGTKFVAHFSKGYKKDFF